MAADVRRVAVVTGGNKGIGRYIVKLLLDRGFEGDVFLTARDVTRGKKTVEELSAECPTMPKFFQLDIDDDTSVEKLKDYLSATYGGLDVLVNNAGIAYRHDSTASFAEQADATVKTNFFGTLRVCRALFPLLRPGARVVHLSSQLGHLSKIPNAELRARLSATDLSVDQLIELVNEFLASAKEGTNEAKGWGKSAYNASKVFVTALGIIQQRCFDKDSREDIIVNSVHPGFVDTDMTNHKGILKPVEGADAATYLAMLPPKDPNNPKGQFVWYDRKVKLWDSNPLPVT